MVALSHNFIILGYDLSERNRSADIFSVATKNPMPLGMRSVNISRFLRFTQNLRVPHETFMIYEDGEPYCEAIIFNVENVK